MLWEEFWEPFEWFERWKRRVERYFARMIRETFPREFLEEEFEIPRVDIMDRGEDIVLRIDLPGVKKEDIDLVVYPDRIEVRARRKKVVEEKGEGYYRRERGYAMFYRVIPLPVKVDPESVEARYEDGVLEVVAKKKEKVEGRKVEIK